MVTRDPVGVVVAITPFNYPLNLLMFKLGAALVAGCTVVAKPSADTPLSTLMLADLFHRNGLPAGVFNVVTGAGRAIGDAMVTHPIPRKIAFTGRHRGGQGDCGGGGADDEAGDAGTGRPFSRHHLRRCRYRQGRRRRLPATASPTPGSFAIA